MVLKYKFFLIIFLCYIAAMSAIAGDREKGENFCKLAEDYLDISITKSCEFSDSALSIANRTDNLNMKADALLLKGIAMNEFGNYIASLKYLEEALELFKSFVAEDKTAVTNTYLGRVYTQIGNYEEAINYFQTALSTFDHLLENNIIARNGILKKKSKLYNFWGLLNKRLDNLDDALKYHKMELKISIEINDSLNIGNVYTDIGRIYRLKNDFKNALEYTQLGYSIISRFNSPINTANAHKKLGLIYLEMGNYPLSMEFFNKALDLYRLYDNKQGEVVCYNSIGRIYSKLGDNTTAKNYYMKAEEINNQTNDIDNTLITLSYYYQLYQSENNYAKAFEYYRRYSDLKDSVYQLSKEINIKQLEIKFKIKEQQESIQKLKTKNQEYFSYFLLAGFIITLIFILLIYNRYNVKSKMNKKLEEKNLELENLYSHLLIAKREADKSILLKENIIRNLSHEIRTPFNNIFGYLKLLNNEISSSDNFTAVNYLNEINRTANSLLGILNDIFDLSQIENNEYKIQEQVFLLNDVVKSITRKYQDEINKKQLELEISEIDDLIIKTDIKLIERVFTHLIDNAIKYTEKGSIHISLEKILNNSNHNILICIEDTGIGIDEKLINKVFDSFEQGDMNTSRKYEGAGLGLTVSKKFLNFIGGDIKITSKKRFGTKISVYLYFENDAII